MKIKQMKEWVRQRIPTLYSKMQLWKRELDYIRKTHVSPDKYPQELEKVYKEVTGISMDIHNPQTYSEKIQWLKLYDPSNDRSRLTDKVAVRKWISETIGEEYLVPILGVYDSFDDIDFSVLPNRFVIKTNHSSGWNVIVKDKKTFNKKKAKRNFDKWMKKDFAFWNEYEIHYRGIVPKIIIEEYLEDSSGELVDYKFLCFDSMPEFVWVDFDRFADHRRNVYDMNWELQPWTQCTYENYLPEGGLTKPEGFDEMKRIAKILCKGFIHVRVDLYNVDGKIYFGEMTFTNGSGFERLYPIEYERIIGDYIKIPNK